jgi:hypothetical protein
VSDWHVSSEESLSAHRYICFKIESQLFEIVIYRNPMRLIRLDIELSALIGGISKSVRLKLDLEWLLDLKPYRVNRGYFDLLPRPTNRTKLKSYKLQIINRLGLI